MNRKQRQRKRKMRLKMNSIKTKFYRTIHSFALGRMLELMEDDLILVQEMLLECNEKEDNENNESEGTES